METNDIKAWFIENYPRARGIDMIFALALVEKNIDLGGVKYGSTIARDMAEAYLNHLEESDD